MTPIRFTPERYRAAAQALRVWFCDMLLWLAECLGDSRFGAALRAQVRDDLAGARRELRMILILLALSQGARWYNACKPVGAHGHQQFKRMDFVRQLTRCIRFRGKTLRDHIACMRDIVYHLDAHVATVARRMARPARQRAPQGVLSCAMTIVAQLVARWTAGALAGQASQTGPP